MIRVLVAAVLFLCALPLRAQSLATISGTAIEAPTGDMTLGGVPQLIAQKLQEAKAAGIVDFAGHLGGGAYVPTYTFHNVAGTAFVEAMDIGYRALQNSKPSVYLMPFAVNVTALSGAAWNFQWARDHVTRSPYPDLWLGVGPLIPCDKAQLVQLKLDQPKNWLAASASVRFK